MAKVRCHYCMGTDIYESRFSVLDILLIPLGFPKRCNSCYQRFHSWKWAKKRSHGPGVKGRSDKGSWEIALPPEENEAKPTDTNPSP